MIVGGFSPGRDAPGASPICALPLHVRRSDRDRVRPSTVHTATHAGRKAGSRGRAHHDVVDCAGCESKGTWRAGVDAQCSSQRPSDCSNPLPRTHADMDPDA